MYDEDTRTLYIDNKRIDLTESEGRLFSIVLENKFKPISYKYLLKKLYNEDEYTNKTRSKVEQLINRLKKKIEKYYDFKKIRNLGVILIWK